MKKIFLMICFGLFLLSSAFSQRGKVSINSQWEFYKGDVDIQSLSSVKEWEAVSIPHTWNGLDMLDDDPGYYRGIGVYKKSVTFNSNEKDKRQYLYFEAVNQDATVYLNGKKVGEHNGGYSAFSFDITSFINWDAANQLVVRVSNKKHPHWVPLAGDLAHFGGIYRDVYVISTNAIHFDMNNHATTGVFISTEGVEAGKPVVSIKGAIENDADKQKKVTVLFDITDSNNKLITTISKKLTLKAGQKTEFDVKSKVLNGIKLWSPEEPNLYQVRAYIHDDKAVCVDEVLNPLGFRYFSLDKDKGFFLNGKHCFIKGMGRHQDYYKIGYAAANEIQINDVTMIKEMGANLIRAHYPQDPLIREECDRQGVMLFGRIALFDEITYDPEFTENTKFLMKELVLQHYNHPSVIFWGSINEIFGNLDWYWTKPVDPAVKQKEMEEARRITLELENYTRELDPSRLTEIVFHADPTPELYRDAGLTEVSSINGWNIYQGWYHGDLSKIGDEIERFRKFAPGQPFLISEYGAGSDLRIRTDDPTIFDFSIEYHDMFNLAYLDEIKKHPWVIGMCIWTWSDFQVSHRGDVMPAINNKGMVTADRKTKDSYFLMKSHWNPEPMIYIAGRDWTSRKDITRGVDQISKATSVYTNLDEVELFVNGKSIGKQKTDNKQVTFNVPFKEGYNSLVARGFSEEKLLEDATVIHYTFQPEIITEDFKELCVNVGQSRTYFFDPYTLNQWLPDQAYKKGSWGHKNGRYYRVWNDMKAWQGIREGVSKNVKGTDIDPVFQTFLVGITDYQFDVPDGNYEVELYFTEPFNESRRLDPEEQTGADAQGNRVFDVSINNKLIIKDLDILRTYGELEAVKESTFVKAENGQGISIVLTPQKGETILSGIRIRKM